MLNLIISICWLLTYAWETERTKFIPNAYKSSLDNAIGFDMLNVTKYKQYETNVQENG